jgi:hypothetical protein
MVVVGMGGINMETKADVEGKIIKSSGYKYIMDFREGLKKYPNVIDRKSYDKVLVDKESCVVE